jgi:hypothetical protein
LSEHVLPGGNGHQGGAVDEIATFVLVAFDAQRRARWQRLVGG